MIDAKKLIQEVLELAAHKAGEVEYILDIPDRIRSLVNDDEFIATMLAKCEAVPVGSIAHWVNSVVIDSTGCAVVWQDLPDGTQLYAAPVLPAYDEAQTILGKLKDALSAALEWIDAVPSDTPLPAMPGFDRDAIDALLAGISSATEALYAAPVLPAYDEARERAEYGVKQADADICGIWDVFSKNGWFMTVTAPLGYDAKSVKDSMVSQGYADHLQVSARHCVAARDNPVAALTGEVEKLRAILAAIPPEPVSVPDVNAVYAQRNELAVAFCKAAVAAGWTAGRGYDDDHKKAWEPEWRHVVYVDLPTGEQVSWHMSPDCIHLLEDLPTYPHAWDGTFNGRKFGWSAMLAAAPQPGQPAPVAAKHIGYDYLDNGQLVATYALPVQSAAGDAPALYAAIEARLKGANNAS